MLTMRSSADDVQMTYVIADDVQMMYLPADDIPDDTSRISNEISLLCHPHIICTSSARDFNPKNISI